MLTALAAIRPHLPGRWKLAKTAWQAQRVTGAQDYAAFEAWLGVWTLFQLRGREIRRVIARDGRKVLARKNRKVGAGNPRNAPPPCRPIPPAWARAIAGTRGR